MTPAAATAPSDGNLGQRTGQACFKHLTWSLPPPAVGVRWAPGPRAGLVGDRALGSEIVWSLQIWSSYLISCINQNRLFNPLNVFLHWKERNSIQWWL